MGSFGVYAVLFFFFFFSLCDDMYLVGKSGGRCMKECAWVLCYFSRVPDRTSNVKDLMIFLAYL